MFLLDSSRYAQDPSGTEAQLNELLERCEATIVAAAPWQDGKLAYPIAGHKKGLHYLTYLKMDGSKVAELGRLCKLSDLVLRHLIIDHSGHGPLFEAMVDALAQHGSESAPEEATAKAAAD
jgi:small subunit ribosomal protein S6